MSVTIDVRLVREPIGLLPFHALPTPSDGALCVFVGVVRDHNAGRSVRYLEYEAYEEMALDQLRALAGAIGERCAVTNIAIAHRLGRIEIGEPSVVVAVASPHRAEAFLACRQAIDTLKASVPIWKKEFYADGSAWIDGQIVAPTSD